MRKSRSKRCSEANFIAVTVAPSKVVDRFSQEIYFTTNADPTHPITVVVKADIVGDVELSEETLHFNDGDDSLCLTVMSKHEGKRLLSCTPMRGMLHLEILEKADEKMKLLVRPMISNGRGTELLRVYYSEVIDQKEVEKTVDIMVGLAIDQRVHFIPTLVHRDADGLIPPMRVHLLFTGPDFPDQSAVANVHYVSRDLEVDVVDVTESFKVGRRGSRRFLIESDGVSKVPPGQGDLRIEIGRFSQTLPFTESVKD